MARHPTIDRERLKKLLLVEKKTYVQISQETGLGVTGVKQAARRYGLTNPGVSHKWAIPWTVQEKHNGAKPLQYLRRLSRIAQGIEVPQYEATTAFRWAHRLVDDGMDLDYDPERSPNEESKQGGFYTKKADPSNWHLKRVLFRATERQTRK